jgi:hypothetical protein
MRVSPVRTAAPTNAVLTNPSSLRAAFHAGARASTIGGPNSANIDFAQS